MSAFSSIPLAAILTALLVSGCQIFTPPRESEEREALEESEVQTQALMWI